MDNKQYDNSQYFRVDIISNAIDSLKTCYDFLNKNDEFKWKWAASSILHSLYLFCIANLEGGNYDNVLCFNDEEDNNRYVKIGNDEKWKKSRKLYRRDCEGYTIQWDYISGDPSFPHNMKKFDDDDRRLINFWTALARVQDKEIHIFFEPIILSDLQWKSINWLYKMVNEIIFFTPCHWTFLIEDFKINIKNILPVLESVSNQSVVYLYGKNNKSRIKEIVDAISGILEGKSIELSNRKIKTENEEKGIIYVEGNNVVYLNKAKEYFKPEIKLLFKNGYGKSDMQNYFKCLAKDTLNNKTVFLFDNDAQKEFKFCDSIKTEMLIPLIIPNNEMNQKVKNGIENLFEESLFDSKFYDEKIIPKNDGGVIKKIELNKDRFCNFICSERNKKEDFINFKQIFEKINEFIIL